MGAGIDKLKKVITESVRPLADRYDWKPTDSEATSRSNCQDYVAGNVFVRVLNDRGLLDMELGPAHNVNEKAYGDHSTS